MSLKLIKIRASLTPAPVPMQVHHSDAQPSAVKYSNESQAYESL